MGAPPKAPIFILSHNPIHHLLNAKKQFYGKFAQCKKHFHPLINTSNDFTQT